MSNFQIAIDGPVAAGKGTIAKKLAARLKFLYVDTGAMYRAATLLFLQAQAEISPANQPQLITLLQQADLKLHNSSTPDGNLVTTVTLNGQDISEQIRTQAVNLTVSQVAALPQIRPLLVKMQQQLATTHNVVMEGRDIGLRVLPDAQLKLYLTASLEERARRRFAQLQDSNPNLTLPEITQQIAERDDQDMHRVTDPLAVFPGAQIIDTTGLSIDQVLEQIIALVKLP